MELLDLREERVLDLVNETCRMRVEYRRMMQDTSGQTAEVQALREENRILKESLAQEQKIKDEVLQRIDTLLERLKDLEQED